MGKLQSALLQIAIPAFLLFNLLLALAILSSPQFRLFSSYLSELGAGPSGEFFNSAVIIAGFALVLFFFRIAQSSDGRKISLLSCLFGILSALSLIGVGLFPLPHELHGPFSVSFFLLSALAVLFHTHNYRSIFGRAFVLIGRQGFPLPLVPLGILHTLLTSILAAAEYSGSPLAPLFETLTVFAFQFWAIAVALGA